MDISCREDACRAESRACVGRERRKVPSAGWSCLGPAEAPAPFKSPITSNVTMHPSGDTMSRPRAAVTSCAFLPSFPVLCCVCYDSCLPVAATGCAHNTKHGLFPWGGRQTFQAGFGDSKSFARLEPRSFSVCSAQQVLPSMAGSNSKILPTSVAKSPVTFLMPVLS